MRKRRLLLTCVLSFCATLIFAQTQSPDLPSIHRQGYIAVDRTESQVATRTFNLKGKEYLCALSWREVQVGPEWNTSSPLPLSPEKAEAVARQELRKLVRDDSAWKVTDFCISRFLPTDGISWYYVLTLKPEFEMCSDSFTVLMNSSGQPGKIGRLSEAAARP